MDEIVKLCGVAVYASAAALMIREIKKDMTPLISAGIALIILCAVLPRVFPAVEFVLGLAEGAGGGKENLVTLVKALGVSYITYIAAELARSAGEGMIASHIETAGKAEIILLGIPYAGQLLDIACRL